MPLVRDPVCNMEMEEEHAAVSRQRQGAVLSFCSQGCAEIFDGDTDRYLSSSTPDRMDFDLIIIGGGPAGLTAALYASIQQFHALFITGTIGGQAVESCDMQNYMGFPVIEGHDLVARFRDQLIQSHFVEHRLDRAVGLRSSEGRFHVHTLRGGTFMTDAVILATGMKARMLGVPGEERLLDRGISSSVVRDGERFRGRDVAVVGGGNSGLQAVSRLSSSARRLYLVSSGVLSGDAADVAHARCLPNLEILENTAVREMIGADHVEGIHVEPKAGGKLREIPVDGVFLEIGFVPDSDFAADLVEINPRGEIVVGGDCSTRTPGLFAAGDVTTAYGKRVIIACGEGAKAALAASAYLSRRKGEKQGRAR